MKKIMHAFFLTCLALGSAMAQDPIITETATIVRVKKGEEPTAVMDALKKDFPTMSVKDISFLPKELYGAQWAVNLQEDDNPNNQSPDYYQVSAVGPTSSFTAVYNKEGKLLRSKEVIKGAQLPASVSDAIQSKYADWKIESNREKIKDGHGRVVTYKVLVEKGKEKRRLLIDPNGQIVRDHKLI